MQHFEALVITVSPSRTGFTDKGECCKLVRNDYITTERGRVRVVCFGNIQQKVDDYVATIAR